MEKISPTVVKNRTRAAVFQTMVKIFIAEYGEDNVTRIGDSEIAVKVATAPTGEPIYSLFSPMIKDYCDRKTNTKTIKAFDVTAERKEYVKHCEEREAEAKRKAEINKKKIERDKAAREKRRAERLATEKREQ